MDKGTTNATGYPIVDEEITLTCAVLYQPQRPDMDTTSVLDYIREQTGINLEVTVLTDQDQVAMMFASRDYPDFIMSVGATDTQLNDAINAGDIVPLDDLIDEYAPTWKHFFETQPLTYATAMHSDGKLYELVASDFVDYDRQLRDVWVINQDWLKELNLEIPTTFEEFKNVMQAFKDNAGVGSIPEDVIPYYILWDSWISGQFDLINSFGVYVSNDQYLWVEEDGHVVCQAINPAIKEPLKYLQELYANGLIAPETFTDDLDTRINRMNALPCSLGSYGVYHNMGGEHYTFIGSLDAENGAEPRMRSQAQVAFMNNFHMFSNNEYPVATIRLCEWIVESFENCANVARGMEGVFWTHTDDGRIQEILWEPDGDAYYDASKDLGFWNSWFNAMLYLRKKEQYPLALVLRNILLSESKMNAEMGVDAAASEYSQNTVEAMRYAIIIVSTLPIMCIYPILQKYFVTGVMVGSIKG